MTSWWSEENLQNALLSFLCRDRKFLKTFGTQLTSKDFKSNIGEGNSREIIASLALQHWTKYHEPIGGLLKSEVLEYIETHKREEKSKKRISYDKKELLSILEFILNGERLVPAESMEDKVRRYLERKFIRNALDEVIADQEAGTLTTKKFAQICRDVGQYTGKKKLEALNIATKQSLEDRIVRRTKDSNRVRPFLLIEGIDAKTKAIGRGDLGILLAPAKVGKSLGLSYFATAYARQRLNVLYISLEDPKDEVEDRFDASWTGIPINQLSQLPNRLKRRFKKFAKAINQRIMLVDGTEEAVSIADIEELYLRLRDQGFIADVVIVDYDDYIKATRKYEKKTDRFDEIYVDFRRFLARYDLIGWTAAQSKRVKEGTQIITMDMAADDIGKMRKATMAIGIGYGKSHPDSRYLYVAAHKRGRMHFGCEIMSAPNKGIFYSREKSAALKRTAKASPGRSSDI